VVSSLTRTRLRLGAVFEPLFPLASPVRHRRWPVVGYCIALPVLTLFLLARQPGVAATRTMWAEDGLVFYAEALARPFFSTLVSSYNGYGQLFPHLAMGVVRLVPIADAALATALFGAVAVAGVALIVFHAARGLVPSVAGRVVLSAATVLLPLATIELLDNVVNVPWWLLFACFWVLLWRPVTLGGKIVALVVCFLTAASDPVAAVFLPVAAARTVALPRVAEQWATTGLVSGLVFQVYPIVWGTSLPSHSSSANLLPLLATQVWVQSLTGVQFARAVGSDASYVGVTLGFVVVVAVLALAWRQRDRGVRLLALAGVLTGTVLFLVETWFRGPTLYGTRYAAVPVLLLLSVLIASLSSPGVATRYRTAFVLVCCLVLAPGWVLGFRFANARAAGPQWGEQIEVAAHTCARSHVYAAVVPITPPPWTMRLACWALRPAARADPRSSP
jgi:hypothetical protein